MNIKIVLTDDTAHILKLTDEVLKPVDVAQLIKDSCSNNGSFYIEDDRNVFNIYPGRSIKWVEVRPEEQYGY